MVKQGKFKAEVNLISIEISKLLRWKLDKILFSDIKKYEENNIDFWSYTH